jgi:hypothetical protein
MLQPTVTRHGPRLHGMLAELDALDAATLYPKDLRLLDAITTRCAQLANDFEDGIAHVRAEQRLEADLIATRRTVPPPGRDEKALPEDSRVRTPGGRFR